MVISPIIFSGIKEDSHKTKNVSILEHASDVYKRGKGLKTPFKIALEAFAWAKWISFNQPVMSLISKGRSIVKLCRPTNRPLKLFMKGLGLWKHGKGIGKSTVSLSKGFIDNGFTGVEPYKVMKIAKDFFKWAFGLVNWCCKAIMLVSDEFLRSIAQTLPDQVSKVGMISAAPLVGMSVLKQVSEQQERWQMPEAKNPLLQKARASTDKAMMYEMMSTLFKVASFSFSALSLFSIANLTPLIPLTFSTAALSSSITALYVGRQGAFEKNYVHVMV